MVYLREGIHLLPLCFKMTSAIAAVWLYDTLNKQSTWNPILFLFFKIHFQYSFIHISQHSAYHCVPDLQSLLIGLHLLGFESSPPAHFILGVVVYVAVWDNGVLKGKGGFLKSNSCSAKNSF